MLSGSETNAESLDRSLVLELTTRGVALGCPRVPVARFTASATRGEYRDFQLSWGEVLRQFMMWALLRRPVTLVEEAPQRWSLLRRELAADEHQLNGRHYAVAFVERCSIDLLDRVVSDEAFHRGLLGISRGVAGGVDIIDLAHALSSTPVSIADMPLTPNLIVTAADGESLWWVDPPLDSDSMVSAIREICVRVGWTLTVK